MRLYDRLWLVEDPADVPEGRDFVENLNPDSLEVLSEARVEPSLRDAESGARFQFERQGYFCVDPDTKNGRLVFNRTATLRDTWAKVSASGE